MKACALFVRFHTAGQHWAWSVEHHRTARCAYFYVGEWLHCEAFAVHSTALCFAVVRVFHVGSQNAPLSIAECTVQGSWHKYQDVTRATLIHPFVSLWESRQIFSSETTFLAAKWLPGTTGSKFRVNCCRKGAEIVVLCLHLSLLSRVKQFKFSQRHILKNLWLRCGESTQIKAGSGLLVVF